MKTIAVTVALLAAALPTLAAADVFVTDAWARASILADRPGAAYLTLSSDTGDRLIAVETPVAGHVMLHGTEMDANGVARMAHIAELDLPSGKTVALVPGGMHLMLMDLTAKLDEGRTFPLILTFDTAGNVTVEVQVRGVAATGPEDTE